MDGEIVLCATFQVLDPTVHNEIHTFISRNNRGPPPPLPPPPHTPRPVQAFIKHTCTFPYMITALLLAVIMLTNLSSAFSIARRYHNSDRRDA